MIKQKATVISVEKDTVWVEAQRQSTCNQCQVKQGCGTGLLDRHVGKRFSRIAVKQNCQAKPGEEVELAIAESALLQGTFLMYLLPLMLMFLAAICARFLELGEVVEIFGAAMGLISGVYLVRWRLTNRQADLQVKIVEETK